MQLPYELSSEADKDLEDIFDYTAAQFGVMQAISYVSSFEDVFIAIGHNPKIGRGRDEIKKGLRSLVKDAHIVFYRISKDSIRIVRILHCSRDITTFPA